MPKIKADNVIIHNHIQVIDQSQISSTHFCVCLSPASFVLHIGNHRVIHLCHECMADLGHAVIDGLV